VPIKGIISLIENIGNIEKNYKELKKDNPEFSRFKLLKEAYKNFVKENKEYKLKKRELPKLVKLPKMIIKTLLNNFDHFGKQAEAAYEIGHAVELATAMEAFNLKQENKLSKAKEKLLEAIQQELFACHYLTDAHAAGHIRTPRQELYAYLKKKQSKFGKAINFSMAGLLEFTMHQEDNKNGVMVENKGENQLPWCTYGDHYCDDERNSKNRTHIIQAVENALKDIYETYQYGNQQKNDNYRTFIPIALTENQQPYPLLFKTQNNELLLQTRTENNNNPIYIRNWSLMKTTFFRCPKYLIMNMLDRKNGKRIENYLQRNTVEKSLVNNFKNKLAL
jgi:hypothetical protein